MEDLGRGEIRILPGAELGVNVVSNVREKDGLFFIKIFIYILGR